MKIIVIKIFTFLLNVFYLPFKLLKTQNKIVMISRQSNNINDDFMLLGKELKKKGYKVTYLCRTLDGGINSKLVDKVSYGFHIFTQLYHLATSKACVLDSYCIAASVLKHKKSLTIFQIWHSIGSMKRFGWQINDKAEGSDPAVSKAMKQHNNYDVVYCAGEAYTDVLSEGFNTPYSKIRIFTLPRIDLLNDDEYLQKTKEEIFKKHPILKEKENVIYAPTFRKDESAFEENILKLINAFDFDKYNLVIKLHPLSKTTVNDSRVITDKEFSTAQMITVADKFISDYSCVIYEAGIKNIPLYFYCYDIDTYKDVRSLSIDYNELPGVKTKDAKELVRSLDMPYDFNYLKAYIKKYIENTKNCALKMADDIAATIDKKSVL